MQTIRLNRQNKTIKIVNRTGALRLTRGEKTVKVVNRRNNIRLQHTGKVGPQGDAGTVDVGTTTTLPAGSSAAVTNVGSDQAAVLDFFIPKGDKGDQGDTGYSTFNRAHHGADANFPRPNAIYVEWVGSVAPNNATVEDTWIAVLNQVVV